MVVNGTQWYTILINGKTWYIPMVYNGVQRSM